MNVFRLSPRTRIVALLAILTVAVSHAGAQDRFLRTVALMEALAPVGIVFVQGIDDPIEAGFLGAAVLLHSVPNIVLLLAESSGNAALTRLSRRVGAGAGLSMSAAALGFGTSILLGAFPGSRWSPHAGSVLALSVPTLFAGLVDLLPYSIEARLSEPAAALTTDGGAAE